MKGKYPVKIPKHNHLNQPTKCNIDTCYKKDTDECDKCGKRFCLYHSHPKRHNPCRDSFINNP